MGDKKASGKEVDCYLQVTQKENQVKSLKKDLLAAKQKVTK